MTPFDFGNSRLTAADFYRHKWQFSQSIAALFVCQDVWFGHLSAAGELKITAGRQEEYPETLKAGANLAVQRQQPIIDKKRHKAFLPISDHGKIVVVIVLSGGSSTLYNNTSAWFTLRARRTVRELRLIKQWSIDPASGLLNAIHLNEELRLLSMAPKFQTSESPPHLLLIEVFPRVHDGGQALANIREVGIYLNSLFGDTAPLHHLGAGIFGLIWPGASEPEIQRLGYAILRKLKRRNTTRVHIGSAPISGTRPQAAASLTAEPLAKAWQALQAARHRGVFALCQAAALEPEQQQLPLLEPAVLAGFKKRWRGENQFAVIHLHGDDKDSRKPVHRDTSPEFPARLLALIGSDTAVIPAGRELFIYLPGADRDEALDWANSCRKKITKLGGGTYSQGIAVYPCPGFRKTDVPLNARKATIHASFSGPAAIAIFDAVSLNISGDIYYNEGDLNGAIREYRLGLNLNPDNINLLNSLGVIYAQIERYKMAMPLFERILSITSDDFMALYNLGFAYLRGGSREQALTYFERALAIEPDSFDLLLQLGQMYCANHQYKKAVKVLSKAEKVVSSPKTGHTSRPWERCEPWHESSDNLGHGLIYRYLGEAYKGINKKREAIAYLQKATRHNSRDARALSLLGELYSIEKQGADIAVTLCRQAVEMDGGPAGHWRRLALTLLKNDALDEALAAGKKSLGIAPKNQDTLVLLARIYQKLGKLLSARTTLERLLKLDGTHKAAGKLLQQINRKKVSVP